jgi:SagB-type dehydrogenase family enzyme
MSSGHQFRKRLGLAISLALVLVLSATFLSGFVASALDLNRFAYHRYAAYLAVALALLHVVLHWRSLTGQLRRWVAGPSPLASRPATKPPSSGLAPEPSAATGWREPHRPRLTRRSLLLPGLSLAAGAGLGHLSAARAAALSLSPGEDLGQVYHQWSKPSYAGLLLKSFHARPQPSPYKGYGDTPSIALPPIPPPGGPALEQVILRRRSIREYADRPVSLDELSRLLLYSAGISDRRDPTFAFRTVPSSGALFPIELYPVVFDVAGVGAGVYHYAVQGHALELVRAGDFRQEVFRAAVSQEMLLRASLALVLSGIHDRVAWKYADRSYRYVLLEAGHLGQNVYLAATGLGLAPCGIGAYFDDDLNHLLGLDGRDEAVVYLLAIGVART